MVSRLARWNNSFRSKDLYTNPATGVSQRGFAGPFDSRSSQQSLAKGQNVGLLKRPGGVMDATTIKLPTDLARQEVPLDQEVFERTRDCR
jgi:hypothetical protein